MTVDYKVAYSEFLKSWVIRYICDGLTDFEEYGTGGTGIKQFESKEKAIRSGERYIKKMVKRGFTRA